MRTRSADALAGMFTARERQVLEHVLLGQTNKEIAYALECSPRTVEFHIAQILRKTGLSSKLAVIANFVRSESAMDGSE
jgi:DNA-binding NarL/FixJ family response regulator